MVCHEHKSLVRPARLKSCCTGPSACPPISGAVWTEETSQTRDGVAPSSYLGLLSPLSAFPPPIQVSIHQSSWCDANCSRIASCGPENPATRSADGRGPEKPDECGDGDDLFFCGCHLSPCWLYECSGGTEHGKCDQALVLVSFSRHPWAGLGGVPPCVCAVNLPGSRLGLGFRCPRIAASQFFCALFVG